MEPLDLLHINLNRLVWYQWRSIRHEQCQVSRLAKTASANPRKGQEQGRAKERKATRARISNQ